MKFNFLKIFGLCAIAMFVGINCYADELPEVAYKYVDSSLTISGEASEGETIISLEILKKDKVFDDPLTFADLTTDGEFIVESVLFCDQQKPDKGKYSFEIKYDCDPGKYAVRVSSNKKIKNTFTIDIVSKTDIIAAYGDLNNIADPNSIGFDAETNFGLFKDKINEKRKELNFGFSLSDNRVLGDELKEYFVYVGKNPLQEEKESENTRIFKTFVTAAMLKGEQVDNIHGVMSQLYIEERILTDYYALAETTAVQQYFTQKLSGKETADLVAFEKNLKAALILTGVRYSDGVDTIRGLLENYGSEFGVGSNADDSVYRQVSGLDFASVDDLKTKLEKPAGKNPPGVNTSDGGAGGGGAAGSFNESYTMESIEKEKAPDTVKVSFEDLDNVMWASEAILALADKGIVNGKGDRQFAPEDDVTREEFVKILVNAMGLDSGQAVSNKFDDVNEKEWYFRYVNIAKDAGLVSGIGNGKFGVGASITREDMVVMLYNALKKKNVEMNASDVRFEDSADISDYAVEAVGALYNLGAVNGVSETEFSPKGIATRAQAAKIVYSVLKLLQ